MGIFGFAILHNFSLLEYSLPTRYSTPKTRCPSLSLPLHYHHFKPTNHIMADDKKNLLDASGSDNIKDDETATAILRKKKKDNGTFQFQVTISLLPLTMNSSNRRRRHQR